MRSSSPAPKTDDFDTGLFHGDSPGDFAFAAFKARHEIVDPKRAEAQASLVITDLIERLRPFAPERSYEVDTAAGVDYDPSPSTDRFDRMLRFSSTSDKTATWMGQTFTREDSAVLAERVDQGCRARLELLQSAADEFGCRTLGDLCKALRQRFFDPQDVRQWIEDGAFEGTAERSWARIGYPEWDKDLSFQAHTAGQALLRQAAFLNLRYQQRYLRLTGRD